MATEGLVRSDNFKIYLMAEVPSMALIPEDLLHKNIDISEILYFMSEHFHELGKTKHHIRR